MVKVLGWFKKKGSEKGSCLHKKQRRMDLGGDDVSKKRAGADSAAGTRFKAEPDGSARREAQAHANEGHRAQKARCVPEEGRRAYAVGTLSVLLAARPSLLSGGGRGARVGRGREGERDADEPATRAGPGRNRGSEGQ